MPGYISLMKYTRQGVANIKDAPKRIADGRAAAERLGIRIVGVWVTMGEHDLVVVFDAPDEKIMSTFLLSLGSLGNVSTQTMRALSEEEFAEVVAKLP